ncbi:MULTISPECIES: BREX-3 system P-loop-containing protein BrxF [Halanaerobium]|uniref:BREX-3 system P-loop-containing protein BrxF n=1 Tax=Halanaerobium congolense TaxID=54121 RepID=A0A1G6SJF3_9FIRM|nr:MULTISPECIES: BREX-3 system P-loop-containing protein BrxF [Halanaerobium]PTX17338.1 hypothetical protein C7953_2120 [Halanaerobium congolense]RCW83487.1 hypothetical protein DER71_11620 [Halanaerobium sp. DL-01]TDS27109.1 hypothetical protein BY453_12911 [Halanaerobium congolense]SDD16771.1 hypothetical protein SAMN04488597_13016 [Halanaerobium congolense]SDF84459.1 hypothetical protein SAMN04488598_1274 [Halanaerobium congolense]
MTHIDDLIKINRDSHYKLLTLVGSEENHKNNIIDYLKNNGWDVYDIEEVILDLVENIPENKIGLKIGDKIKEWLSDQENKIVITNTSIIYSPELNLINPVETFRYAMRGDKEAVIFIEGKMRDDKVIYSTPDKQDHKDIDISRIVSERITEVEVN